MNKLETLPKMLSYGRHIYFFDLHVNFRGNLVIQYSAGKEGGAILSYVVEPANEPYIPESFASSDGFFNENIGNMKSLDECIDQIAATIKENGIEEYVG